MFFCFLQISVQIHHSTGKLLPPFPLLSDDGDVANDDGPKFVSSSCTGSETNCEMILIAKSGKVRVTSFRFW